MPNTTPTGKVDIAAMTPDQRRAYFRSPSYRGLAVFVGVETAAVTGSPAFQRVEAMKAEVQAAIRAEIARPVPTPPDSANGSVTADVSPARDVARRKAATVA